METLINNFVIEHLAAFIIIVIIAVIALVLLVWKLASLWYRFKHLPCDKHLKKLEELQKDTPSKVDLPCQAHSDKIEQHSNSVTKLETTLAFLMKNNEEISSQLLQLNNKLPFTQQHSPLTISPRGMEVIKKLHIDRMFEENWGRIKQLINEEVIDKTPYDVNEFCIKYAVVYPEKFLSKEDINTLKEDAYKQGLFLIEYMRIIAVMARDRYFKETGLLSKT